LYGVCYIHERKQQALMNDCAQAYNSFKTAFRPSAVESKNTRANPAAITMQEPSAERQTFLWDNIDDEVEE
jgi:hypothetical protein